jgi:hypothetical protein
MADGDLFGTTIGNVAFRVETILDLGLTHADLLKLWQQIYRIHLSSALGSVPTDASAKLTKYQVSDVCGVVSFGATSSLSRPDCRQPTTRAQVGGAS